MAGSAFTRAHPILHIAIRLKAIGTQYANAIKTLHDTSPHFKCFVVWLLVFPCRFYYSMLFALYVRSVCLLALCKYFLFTFGQLFFYMERTRFISANEFSSAVSHISKFFSFLCLYSSHSLCLN